MVFQFSVKENKLFPSVIHNSNSIILGLQTIIFNNWSVHKEEDSSKDWERNMDYECKQVLNQLGQFNLKFTETRLGWQLCNYGDTRITGKFWNTLALKTGFLKNTLWVAWLKGLTAGSEISRWRWEMDFGSCVLEERNYRKERVGWWYN